MTRFWKNCLTWIAKILAYFISIILIITLFLHLIGINCMYVVSNSMVPTFKKGDLVLVNEKNYGPLHKDDIVAYKAAWLNNEIVTHRIINIDDHNITVKGDNNSSADPTFEDNLVYGKIVGVGSGLGWLFNPYTEWSTIALIIVFISLADLIEYIEKKKYVPKRAIESESNE